MAILQKHSALVMQIIPTLINTVSVIIVVVVAQAHVKQRCVGKHAVEALGRQIERQKILVQHRAAGGGTGHGDEFARAVEARRRMAHVPKGDEVAARPTTEIENGD